MGAIPAREYFKWRVSMALAYLLCPTFQIVNSAGKPATGGYLEVYLAGSRTKYFCSSDFDGTRHPFQIPLDSLGSNVVLADDANTYDVYVYNRYGSLLMSRYGVKPGAGGGAGFCVLTSSDGSVTIVETPNGYDLTVNIPEPSVLRAGADTLNSDGQFVFYELVRDGDKIKVDNAGKIRLEQGWYHYDITVRIVWDTEALLSKTVPLQLYTTLSSDVLDFDASYAHNDTVHLSGETKIVSNDAELVFGIIGLEPGMGAEVVDMGVHAIYVSFGEDGNYQAGDYIDISPEKVISVTGVQPESAMTAYATVDSLSSYLPTADFTSYSAGVNSAITSLSSDVSSLSSNVSSISSNISSISSVVSGLTGVYLEQSASALFAPSSLETSKMDVSGMSAYMLSGDYLSATASSLFAPSSVETSKLDASASSSFAQASSLSGYIPTSVSSDFVQNSAFTSYTASALTAIDNSISSIWSSMSSMSSDVSGKVDQSAMSAWIPYSALDYSGTAISGIGGSSLAGMGGGDYTGVYPVSVDNTAREIAVDSQPLVTDSSMTAYVSAGSSVIGVNMDIMSGKLDTSAQVVTATSTQLYAGSAYLTGVNGAPVSASRAGNAANASMANSAYYDGAGRLISSLPGSAAVSSIASSYATGKQDTLAFAYNTANQISSINGSALGGMDEAAVSSIASAYAGSAASSKLDTSAFNSGDFYSTSNPSGFITGVDLTPYQPTSAMSAYATTAYVESGLSGKENVFSAGTGLEFVQSGSDRYLQVEAPVDIVAGPGIVIDNPDGNTLRVSVENDVENVLFDQAIPALTNTMTLSESMFNFKYVEVCFYNPTTGDNPICYRYPTALLNTSRIAFKVGWAVNYMTEAWLKFTPTSDVKVWTYVNNTVIQYRNNVTTVTVLQDDSTYLKSPAKLRIVGIHRIAGGN